MMSTIIEKLHKGYQIFNNEWSDPRTSKWFLMSSPWPIITILVSYLYFCTSLGPRYMKDKKPYSLKRIILVYNIFQIIFSIFLFYEGLVSGWWNDYSFNCQPVDYSNNPKAIRCSLFLITRLMAQATWWYLMAKLSELMETIFFVFRKKDRQISFLHLFHHSMMPVCAWVGTKFLPGGHGTLLGVINAFIHIIMYTYYLVAGLGPEYQKYLRWKRHLTTIQLIQFAIVLYHNIQVMFRDCDYPKYINLHLAIHAAIFIYMFGKFYIKNYKSSNKMNRSSTEVATTSKVKGS